MSLLDAVPPELFESILSYLDEISLSQCCLVSKQWVLPARIHLFREIRVSDNEYVSYRTERLQCLDDNPYLAQYIRSLTIEHLMMDDETEEVIHAGFALLEKLTCLEELALRQFNFFDLPNRQVLHPLILSGLRSVQSTVRKLYLDDIGFVSFDELERFVCSFPNLGKLDMYYVEWKPDDRRQSRLDCLLFENVPRHQHKPRLVHLDVYKCADRSRIQEMVLSFFDLALSSFHIQWNNNARAVCRDSVLLIMRSRHALRFISIQRLSESRLRDENGECELKYRASSWTSDSTMCNVRYTRSSVHGDQHLPSPVWSLSPS